MYHHLSELIFDIKTVCALSFVFETLSKKRNKKLIFWAIVLLFSCSIVSDSLCPHVL